MIMTSNPNHDISINDSFQTSHAIDRSDELLSVARTALSILDQEQRQRQQEQYQHQYEEKTQIQFTNYRPSNLSLHNPLHDSNNTAKDVLSEAVLTLNHLDETLKKLSKFVKRRGHTNDPTNDINNAMCDFQSFVKDIMEIIDATLPQAAALPPMMDSNLLSTNQRRKHYEMAAKILKGNVEERMENFKDVMKVRGDVIKDLTLRRKQLLKSNHDNNGTNNGVIKTHPFGKDVKNNGGYPMMGADIANVTIRNGIGRVGGALQQKSTMEPNKVKSQLNSPLFTMSTAPISNPYAKSNQTITQSTSNSQLNNRYSNYKQPIQPSAPSVNVEFNKGYGYGYNGASSGGYNNGAGYGGYNNISDSTGMRKRAGGTSLSGNITYNPYQTEDEVKVHSSNDDNIQTQIQKRRQARQTQSRLESAKLAEKTLAELTSMFGKMSSLIQSQGETLEKIEDDVEVAMGYVDDGYEEVGKLYEYTKGNRGLIIKCFGILIFVIIFMRYYG